MGEDIVFEPEFTTVMIRQLPKYYEQEQLISEISVMGLEFDFLFVPKTKFGKGNRSYAFVNFVSASDAKKFIEEFEGHQFADQSPKNTKYATCSVAKLQGFEDNMRYYQPIGASVAAFVKRN